MASKRPTQPAPANGWLKFCIPAALFVAVAGCAYYACEPYLACGFRYDDYDFQRSIGCIQTGQESWAMFLIGRWGPRLMPLWKLAYSTVIIASGCSPRAMHLFIMLLHAVSAGLLYVLLRRLNFHWLAAAASSLLWAGAAVGGTDSPGVWPFTGYITVSIILLLALSILLTHASLDRRWPYYLLVATTTLALILADSPNLAFVPFFAAGIALGFRAPQARALRRRLLLSLGFPFLITAPLALLSAYSAMGHADRQRQFDLSSVLQRTAAELSFALGTLVYDKTNLPDSANLTKKYLLAAVVLAMTAIVVAPRRRLLFWGLVAATIAHVLSFNVGGVDVEFLHALNAGRYLYFPTFFWCLLAALLLTRLLDEAPARRVWLVLAPLVVVFPFYLAHQRAVAAHSATVFGLETQEWRQAYDLQRAVLVRLAKQAEQQRQVISLLDVPVRATNSNHLLWPASAFAATCVPEAKPYLEFRDYEPDNQILEQQLALIASCESPGQPSGWQETILAAEQLRKQFEWLVQLGRDRDVPIVFPNVSSNLAGLPIHTGSFLAFYDLLGPGKVELVNGSPADIESITSLQKLVESSDAPQSQAWRQDLQSLRSQLRD